MPKPDASASAVIVSGGKQYRVAPGDRILVDRLAAEPGSAVKLGRVLLFDGGDGAKLGTPAIDGIDVDARVIAHRRGPRIESIRYKSKKRVRVHQGGRAHLTALEIIAVGGVGVATAETDEETKEEKKAARPRGRSKAAPKKKAEVKAEVTAEEPAAEAEAPEDKSVEKPVEKKTTSRRRAKKESE